jgi:hypothetical protein
MKHPALAGALALASISLAGCASTGSNSLGADIANFNAQVANNLPAACALIAGADGSFQTIVATGKISNVAIADESVAMAGVNSICANPGAANAASALQALANAYVAVVEAGKAD